MFAAAAAAAWFTVLHEMTDAHSVSLYVTENIKYGYSCNGDQDVCHSLSCALNGRTNKINIIVIIVILLLFNSALSIVH